MPGPPEGPSRVELGPIPGLPDWHQQSTPSSYPFPTTRSGMAFAKANQAAHPDRVVIIEFSDGRRWDGTKWLT